MKLCQSCNEFMCGLSGTKSISSHCGDNNYKISCYIFSHSREKAIEKIHEISSGKYKKVVTSRYDFTVETEHEIWRWVNPTTNKPRGIRPIKAYIDEETPPKKHKEVNNSDKPSVFLLLNTLYFDSEVQKAPEITKQKPTKQELDLAKNLISQMTGKFEPEKYKDEYHIISQS